MTTQQTWLREAYSVLRAELIMDAPDVDKVVLSYGFPSRGARTKTAGECHYSYNPNVAAQGGVQGYSNAIFIHPREWVGPVEVLTILVHEMAHAARPGCGHKGEFVKLIRKIGLEGKPTATVAGSVLAEYLTTLTGRLDKFPAAPIWPHAVKRVGSRLRLWVCECPVRVRVASDAFNATCNQCKATFKRSGDAEGNE